LFTDTQRKLKHDRYLEAFTERIRPLYENVQTNVTLYSKRRNKQRKIAEIDILAKKNDDSFDVFEVKCSYRIVKARKQLKRIKRLMPKVDKTFLFCGESGLLETVITT